VYKAQEILEDQEFKVLRKLFERSDWVFDVCRYLVDGTMVFDRRT
jgi:hypothetical protein